MHKNTDYKKIPNCLSKYRRLRGLSQKEAIRILGYKNSTVISRWERGKSLPKAIIFLFELAVLYKTSSEAIFHDLYRTIKNEVLTKEENVFKENESKRKID